jgi:hypothetical protein
MTENTGSSPSLNQPPVRVAVLLPFASANAHAQAGVVRGRVVSVSYDERGLLWAHALLDPDAPAVSLHGYPAGDSGVWPQPDDTYVATAIGYSMVPVPGGFSLVADTAFIYARPVPDSQGSPT